MVSSVTMDFKENTNGKKQASTFSYAKYMGTIKQCYVQLMDPFLYKAFSQPPWPFLLIIFL